MARPTIAFLLFRAVCYDVLQLKMFTNMNTNQNQHFDFSPNEMFSQCWRTLFAMLMQPSVKRQGNRYIVLSGPLLQRETQKINDLQHKMADAITHNDFNDPIATLSEMINNAKESQYQTKFYTFVDTYEILINAISSDARYQVWLNTNEAILRHSVPLFERLSHQIMREQLEAQKLAGKTPTLPRKM